MESTATNKEGFSNPNRDERVARYCKRVWLNEADCEATGSVVAFNGMVERWKGRIEEATFLEIADCNGKVSLHRTHSEEVERFIRKLRRLACVANEFAKFLEENEP